MIESFNCPNHALVVMADSAEKAVMLCATSKWNALPAFVFSR